MADPHDTDTYLVQAWAHYEAHALDAAIQAARSACEASPDRPDSAAALGWFLLESAQLPQATEVLRHALERHPDFPTLHWYWGMLCFRERRLDAAHQSLQRALQLDPQLDEAASALAWVLHDMGRLPEASQWARTALDAKPGAQRHAQLGWLLLAQERWDEALVPLRAALALEPDLASTRTQLIQALTQLDRAAEADTVRAAGFVREDEARLRRAASRPGPQGAQESIVLPFGDYVSPGLKVVQPDAHFPHMVRGDTSRCDWPYFRREIPHNWYVDPHDPECGFISRDEALVLYNTALMFKGKQALEIGCWMGWSACHMALAGVHLTVVDPVLDKSPNRERVAQSLSSAMQAYGSVGDLSLVTGLSPQAVDALAAGERKWSLFFIDGNHSGDNPLNDAMVCERHAEADALILFHDLASPDVAQGLNYLARKGWHTMAYNTMQIMGVAWRGNVEPVAHIPDPKIPWTLPPHLQHTAVSGVSQTEDAGEFLQLLASIRPFTLLSTERLFSLYTHAKLLCQRDIPGNFVECGSYQGGAAALLASVVQRHSLRPRKVYAFDTFQGMPEPAEVDRHNGTPANDTAFGAGTLAAPVAEYLAVVCARLGVTSIVEPVPGLFAHTLPARKADVGPIALLHADADWYASTMDIFSTLYDAVSTGGVVQIDDFGYWEGCRKAVRDFERISGEVFALQRIDHTGVWFQKKSSTPCG
ncbi:class I SAM-dependent methyltransferase [Rhodoferax sp. AJA081-3]|uniref:class I SAM-dependent methyltransferase n=1 Tax=Rhodoferax sp. AJA081-3 TaxID=2752316 RepID=UPI001ADF7141|nr:TylF/MycF/NovP-related O-methyltransferase [Rhodoferax sp. AJA081-3]QTN29917.1 class I SAM-dependent methyltransferase [Rhodoferax sp. AJA081-3]